MAEKTMITVEGVVVRLITSATCPICEEENFFDTGTGEIGNVDDSDSNTCPHFVNVKIARRKDGTYGVNYIFDKDAESECEDCTCCDEKTEDETDLNSPNECMPCECEETCECEECECTGKPIVRKERVCTNCGSNHLTDLEDDDEETEDLRSIMNYEDKGEK